MPPILKRVVALAAVAAAVVLAVTLATGGSSHRFSFVVPEATGLITGQRVTDGAQNIGSVAAIDPVRGGRAARLTLRITDDRYWPLKASTKVAIRLGGTVSFSNRYLYLTPGTGSGPDLADGGTLAAANVKTPVEFDQLVGDFTPGVRRDIGAMIQSSADVADRSAASLHAALPKTPALARAAADAFGDLAHDRQALRTLVGSTSRVVDAVDRADPDVRTLLDGLAQTSDAVADDAGALKVGLDRLPAALAQTRRTLGTADSTLTRAARLTDRLAPGVTELRRITRPLSATLASLRADTPLALAALSPEQQRRLGRGADLATAVGSIAPRVTSIATKAAPEVGCLRPYAPEIASFGAKWGDWISPVDARDHLFRAQIQNYLPTAMNSTPYTPAVAAKLFPGLEYGFPRPPGQLAGQPWFQPQCGVTKDSIDPAKDPEAQKPDPDDAPPSERGRGR
jgi:ABC-type transporter Mla subunit MlaD